MPLYEYQCESCGTRFERIQKLSDPPPSACPKCGQGPIRKLISSPAIQFKGTGWYVTDYSSKGKPTDAAPTESSKAEGAKAEEKKDTSKDTPKDSGSSVSPTPAPASKKSD